MSEASPELERARALKAARDEYRRVVAELTEANAERQKCRDALAAHTEARELRNRWERWRSQTVAREWVFKVTPKQLADGDLPAGLTREQFAQIDAFPAVERAFNAANGRVNSLEKHRARLEGLFPELA